MTPSHPAPTEKVIAIKREHLDNLLEEYKAAHKQLSAELSEVNRLRLRRQIETLESEIRHTEHELAQIQAGQANTTITLKRPERAEVRRFLVDYFTLEDLKDLAFDLCVDFKLAIYTTVNALARELIAYFEIMDRLGCLVQEIISLHPDSHDALTPLLDRLPPCTPFQKLVIIVARTLLETVDISQLKADLAAQFGVELDQITIIAAARGTARLLLGLPEKSINDQVLSKIRYLGEYPITAIIPFDTLDTASQKTWRLIAHRHPPLHPEDNTFHLVASWTDALQTILRTTQDWSGASLRQVNLCGVYLREVNLQRADLGEADLSWAYLSWANLSEADLSEANLSEANLSEANLSGAVLILANLSGANLRRADLSGAILFEVNLRGANLSGADLREAGLILANLSEANLSNADLSGADLRKADLREADLSQGNLSNADLSGADLRETNLSDADLRGANLGRLYLGIVDIISGVDYAVTNLRGADLRGADLRETNLSDADLSGANLSGADLRGADLRGADLSKAKYNQHTQWLAGFDPQAHGLVSQ